MRELMNLRSLIVASLLSIPALAVAQPGEPAGPMPPTPPAADDDARIKEMVDKEVARILTDRAAKEAADKAAKEAIEKEAPPADKPGDLTGDSGFMDTRLAFTV